MARILPLLTLALATLVGTPASAATPPAPVNGCVRSVQDPSPTTTAPVDICYTLFRPAGASPVSKVPVIMHSHGWGGSRITTIDGTVQRWLDAGYGVLSFDQRGFGESGGHAYVENPAYEGIDVQKMIGVLAAQDWVQMDGPGDPRLGAIGGSYGGGYQFVGAFTNLMTKGKPIFDVLAPEITWFDLTESLSPQGVSRTEWASALSAASLQSDALPPNVYKALLEAAATGNWPDGSTPGTENLNAFFEKNGPKWHVSQGRQLNIPVLFGQGATDTLFPLEQGFQNWAKAITKSARARSIFIAYNGGHILPSVFPQSSAPANADPCSVKLNNSSFGDLTVKFFNQRLRGMTTDLTGYGKYHLATAGGTCTTVSSIAPNQAFSVGTVTTTAAAGAPTAVEIASGPIRVAGSPNITADVTTIGVDNRAFYGLAIGTSPQDAKLVQNNVLPVRQLGVTTVKGRTIDLPAVAVDVPAGQKLFLYASPVSDMFAGMASRTPGTVTLTNAAVHLPVVN
ncbi:MAG TPA: CocE/NonD family hydrolase [Aeromicrobium sp.]|nr:CocE/NonD family hydrolase [Aeromicrobium sp.]